MRSTKIILCARAQDIGIIDEPDIGLRVEQDASAPVVVHSFDRLNQITATVKPDGKAAVVWELRKDR